MSCCITKTFGVPAFESGIALTQGISRLYNNEVYWSKTDHTTASTPDEDTTNWIRALDIDPNYIQQIWELNDGVTYNQFDVIVTASNKYYMVLKDHVQNGTQSLNSEYYKEFEIDCFCKLRLNAETEYDELSTYSAGDEFIYEGLVYIVIRNIGTNYMNSYNPLNPPIPYEIYECGLAGGGVFPDCNFDMSHTPFNPANSYNVNAKVFYLNSYWISAINGNQTEPSLTNENWYKCDDAIPECRSTQVDNENWSEGTYDFNDTVYYNQDLWVSTQNENTEEPGTGNKWISCAAKSVGSCSEYSTGPYDPNRIYNAGEVAEDLSTGLFWESKVDGNTAPIGQTKHWQPCDEIISINCSENSTGLWSNILFYNIGDVVEFFGSWYYSTVPQAGNIPSNGIPWALCESGPQSNCSENSVGVWAEENAPYGNGVVVEGIIGYYYSLSANNMENPNDPSSKKWVLCKMIRPGAPEPLPEVEYVHQVYSELFETWVQEMSYEAPLFMQFKDFVYSAKEQAIKIHQYGKPNILWDLTAEDLVITCIINDAPNMKKVFSNIRAHVEGDSLFTNIKFKTELSPEQTILGTDHQYRKRIEEHVLPLMSDSGTTYMRGYWCQISFTYTGGFFPKNIHFVGFTTKIRLGQ